MNILVVGGGFLGRGLAEDLDRFGHDVAVIDESAENLAQLSPDFQGVTTVGFPMDMVSLQEAGIEGCDAVAVVTSDDNLNIAVGQIAKDVFGIGKVVARISDPARESIFQTAGLLTACPTNMASEKLAAALLSPYQSKQVTFGANTVALEPRPVDKRLIGRTTAALETSPGEGLFAVVQKGGRLRLHTGGDIPLEEGDLLIFSRVID